MATTSATQPTSQDNIRRDIPGGLDREAVVEISRELRHLLSDVFALYIKTKNFHWHMSGSHFHDYHLLLDEQGEQIFAMTDVIAERARKLWGSHTSLNRRHLASSTAGRQRLRSDGAPIYARRALRGQSAADAISALLP
jgi:starvation-inducible DNA-binding protein